MLRATTMGFLAAWFCLWTGIASAQGTRDTVAVRILHSNDVYGQLTPVETDSTTLGGMARRVHLIRELRQAGPTLVVGAGDAIGPSALSAWDKGKTMVEAMRLAGYTAMVPGNHEFGYGLKVLRQRREDGGFRFLAANLKGKNGVEPPVQPYMMVDIKNVKIGLLGVLSPGLETRINPKYVANLTFGDPVKAAREAVKALREKGAEYVIALVHMPEPEALALAQKVAGLDLVVAGGYGGLDQTMHVPSLVRLVNGVQLVTTPRFGTYLGAVEVRFVRQAEGGYRAVSEAARLYRLGPDVPEDPEAAALIGNLVSNYEEATGEILGRIDAGTLEAQATIVANLMRWHTDEEVGIVNRGTFHAVEAQKPLYLKNIYGFIRFDDLLVKMVLTGRQLKEIVQQSRGQESEGSGLAFAGLDPKTMMVNGRPIQNDEPFHVVVPDFLAGGGDGYRTFEKGTSVVRTGISLRSLVVAGLKAWGTLSPSTFESLNRKGVWRSGWAVEGSFQRNYINRTTGVYRARSEQVSFLSGETSVAWNGITRFFLDYETGPHAVRFENTADFGQIGQTFDNLETSSDRLDADLTYRYRTKALKVEPVFSTGISTAFSKTDGGRPFQYRASAGFQRRFFRSLVVRFAARGQRDFLAHQNDYGAEVTLAYARRIAHGGRFRSSLKNFFGLSNRKVISIENYNTFSFPLVGSLSLTVRQNNFLYRVDKIQGVPVSGVAFRTDLTVGFAYGLDWKWL